MVLCFFGGDSRIGRGGWTSLRDTGAVSDLRRHFLHKGKSMGGSHRHVSPRIARQVDRVHAEVLKSVAASVKGLRPRRILDVGTGYGMSLNLLASQFGEQSRICSVDASSEVVREMKRVMRQGEYSRHVTVKRANAERLPFKNNHFDLVVSLFALHHFSNPSRGLFEMGRVASRGGKLILADWRPEAGKPLRLHAASDIPSPNFVNTQLKRLGYRTGSRIRRYWYLTEAMK